MYTTPTPLICLCLFVCTNHSQPLATLTAHRSPLTRRYGILCLACAGLLTGNQVGNIKKMAEAAMKGEDAMEKV